MNELNTLLSLASAGAISFSLAGVAVSALAMFWDKTPLRPINFTKGIAAFYHPVRPALCGEGVTTVIAATTDAANEATGRAATRAA